MKHNQTPWPMPTKETRPRGNGSRCEDEYYSIDIDGNSWINFEGENPEENSIFVFRAVNCHEDLVKWCEWLFDNIQSSKVVQNGEDEIIEDLLKRAKGRS